MSRLTPEVWHERQRHRGSTETCGLCAKARKTCESKKRFVDKADAEKQAKAMNEREEFERPVTVYVCVFCRCWHLTSSLRKHQARKVAERQAEWSKGQSGD